MSDLGLYHIYPEHHLHHAHITPTGEPQNLLHGEQRWSRRSNGFEDESNDDVPALTINEGIYLFVLSLAGVSLGYVAASLTWPGNLAPLVVLAVLLYLIITHRTPLSPSPLYQIHLPSSSTLFAVDDEESLISNWTNEKKDDRLREILEQERKGMLAGVYAFGKGEEGGEVWVVVEDMDG